MKNNENMNRINAILDAKKELLSACKITDEIGFNIGTAGNISVRVRGYDLFVITPTSMPYCDLNSDDLVLLDFNSNVIEGNWKPSVEYNMHKGIFVNRRDVNCVCHVHSTFATAYASIDGVNILPALDIETLSYLGGELTVADYADAGSQELADNALKALGKTAGVLLANHGMIGVGKDVHEAILVSKIIEKTCYSAFLVHTIGKPRAINSKSVEKGVNKYLIKHNLV